MLKSCALGDCRYAARSVAPRLRPILMTTLTTVVGLLPLAAGFGEGGELLQPLAVAIVAGLTMSTLVTLLLIPLLYQALQGG